MESLYVVFMRHMIRKISVAAILGFAVAVNPVFARGLDLANAGIRALDNGRVDDSVDLLTQGIQSGDLADDQLAMAYHHRGIAHQSRGDTARAILDYTNAMQRGILAEELRPRALNNRGICFEMIGDLEAALRDLNRAITLRPDYADAYVNRASVLRKMSAFRMSVQDYARANALGHPRPFQIAHGLAQTYEAAGDRAQAQRYYRQAAAIDPNFVQTRDRVATQRSPVLVAEARPQGGRGSQVGSDAQPSTLPETMGENVLRATIFDNSGPVTGSGFAQEIGSTPGRLARVPQPSAIPTGRGPKGGPETSELVPLLKDEPVVRLPPAPPKIAAAPPVGANVEAVQLASYGSEALARAGWNEISTRFSAELGSAAARIVEARHPRKGVVYRLHATGLNASAASLCARLKRRGQQCLPGVLPGGPAAPG
jgi:tetratricopeptide (TPR) repeat protein